MNPDIAKTVRAMTRDEARVLAHYGSGETAKEIADGTGISMFDIGHTLDALAGNNRQRALELATGWQEHAKAVAAARGVPTSAFASQPLVMPAGRPITPAAARPAPPQAEARELVPVHELQIDDISTMLDAAEAAGGKLRRSAEKIRDHLTVLQADLAEHAREAGLRAEAAELEKRLAAIRDELRPKRPAAARPVEPIEVPADSKAIRAWAATENVACPKVGRIPGDVVARYRRAVAA